MKNNSFYNEKELLKLGFKSVGSDVRISRDAKFYSPSTISIGNNVRIDDFCILSGNIILKNNIHISTYCALYGAGGIIMEDYSGLSPRCTLLSASDDFSGEYMVGPQNDERLTNVQCDKIKIDAFCQLGANTVVLPGVHIEEGAVTGAMSLVVRDLLSWKIYVGQPARIIKDRSRKLKTLVDE